MNTKFNRPKGFGEILDLTFSLSKNRFKDFFTILLIFMGPFYALEALIRLGTGTSFFRQVGAGDTWFESMITGLEDTGNIASEVGVGFVGFLSIFIFPIGSAAILLAVNHLRKNEDFTIGSVIRQAFSRYWPIIGSSILFSLIIIGLVIVPIFVITIAGVIGAIAMPIAGIIFAIILFLGFAVGIGYLLTRWSFYFGSVVLQEESPGFSRSWTLTRGRAWAMMGLYIIFFLIISCISLALEFTFGLALGNSVLLSIIINLATIFTTLIFSVGFAVMYFDLKIRHDADDLKDMIDNYNPTS
ncbi:hypothetical protein [Bacillus sp. FJAT-50079]|uniref:hypothetical protein n=1 Tax=Bacillus sp. FJAT-50079 TaxID=2833577 RepID=UPI001BC98CE7|nr:hypothetical protein [Bacillus sp. FJAT-50079]MBS4208018.1 hypothetical protein [Bacillus sp. FJAT-50079]